MKGGENMKNIDIEKKLNELKDYTTAWVVVKKGTPNIIWCYDK